MSAGTVYVVDSAHRIRRECGNCALAEWSERMNAIRCPWNRRWRTVGVSEPCGAWKLEEEALVWSEERKEWLR